MTNRPALPVCFFVAAAAFLAVPLLALRLNPNDYKGGRSRSTRERDIRNSSAIATVLGEFRTAMSDIMYIKSELYLDNGIAYMPHLQKKLSISGQKSAAVEHIESDQPAHGDGEEHHEHAEAGGEDAGTPTVIPTPEKDFRGFIGSLERQVKPWQDPSIAHHHSDGTELLPWFRMMTLSDRHYILGYTVGSWWLQRQGIDEAIKYAQEGIDNNPDSFEVWFEMGQLRLEKGCRLAGVRHLLDPPPEALAEIVKARDYYHQAAQLAMKERPPNAMELLDDPRWGHYAEDDARAAIRLSVLSESQYGDKAHAMELARQYLQVFPDDLLLKRKVAESATNSPSNP